jgi:D-glycero-alpha-D-manno-heptose-7-phosphate kinase
MNLHSAGRRSAGLQGAGIGSPGIRSAAPIRLCDLGGWTDTWFAGHGCVLNLAALPAVEVEIRIGPADAVGATRGAGAADGTDGAHAAGADGAADAASAADEEAGSKRRVVIHAENFGPPYARDPRQAIWDQHPLIEAALESLPPLDDAHHDHAYHVNIFSAAPPGASVGSSAATAVALLAAIAYLRQAAIEPDALAAAAHRLETDRLGQQAGVQDQLCAAHGGACFIEIDRYPAARVTQLPMPDAWRWELDARLVLVYLGRAHDSSALHERVIHDLAGRGPDAPALHALRQAALAARDAFVSCDVASFGRAMQANTDAQAALHPDLISVDAQRVIAIARARGALGWKVNGAGGDGGSLTILTGPSMATRRAMLAEIEAEDPAFRVIPIRLSPTGVRVWRAHA